MKRFLVLLCALSFSGPLLSAGLTYSQPRTPEERLQVLERKASAQQKALNEQMQLTGALRREIQELRGQMELQTHTIEALKGQLRSTYMDLDQRLPGGATDSGAAAASGATASANPAITSGAATAASAPGPTEFGIGLEAEEPAPTLKTSPPRTDLATGTAGLSPTTGNAAVTPVEGQPAAVPPGDPALEKDEYQTAFKILMQRDYAEAAQALSRFLARYPNSQYADNAQYWLAEAHYANRDFPTALAEFQKVVSQYPESPKVPDALLKSGYIHYEMQQWPEASGLLDQVVREHAGSTAARLAQQRLDRMRREGH